MNGRDGEDFRHDAPDRRDSVDRRDTHGVRGEKEALGEEDDRAAVQAAVDGEMRLLDPEVRASGDLVDAYLHPDFTEIGQSGRVWDRAAILAALPAGATAEEERITASEMRGVRLAHDVVHLTFVTEWNGSRARRSSLWLRTGEGWKLWFHQGTPA
ncbi:DUF4440 domain-containing protein [Streptomyces sp. GC420]|uniref:nuclear transport factor 2 family protein n=1 Tax=Streptomyces sp. GC420 TaxID=2697568 RepID=UPI001414D24C|nr:nuclear transport factor 2 family protein [Streptomyces sp. GC420]NBM18071.1 DUF4440 domain-containing protein [Streptomyces sp. GC420]